jgi:hypothetical protein
MAKTNRVPTNPEILRQAIIRLRSRVMALVGGLLGGTTLLLITIWHLVRIQGKRAPDISLLRNYFPGYDVSWTGALVGFLYGAVTGAVIGWVVSWIYNFVATRRAPG